jgi:hypothetical protein
MQHMQRLFRFVEFPPLAPPDAPPYWIALDVRLLHSAGDGIIIGRKCRSLPELEAVVKEFRADLDRALEDARAKLGGKEDTRP